MPKAADGAREQTDISLINSGPSPECCRSPKPKGWAAGQEEISQKAGPESKENSQMTRKLDVNENEIIRPLLFLKSQALLSRGTLSQ